MESWRNCKNILVIRPDNMGDVIMMIPCLRALKDTFGCRITLLTSQQGALIAPYINYIDETLVYNLPWVRSENTLQPEDCTALVEKLKSLHFDGAIISTVYSQNPMPAALIAFMSCIPFRLAYCRENPYDLLTHWVVDKEPYRFIQHQVLREIKLVAEIGAFTANECLTLRYDTDAFLHARQKLYSAGVAPDQPFIILHPGVSEVKREYPLPLWIRTARHLYKQTGRQILITGNVAEKPLADTIQAAVPGTFTVAGLFNIEEFIAVVARAQLVISVNTATVHIAAATNTPVIVLYALTNPQHTPWKVPSVVLHFSVTDKLQSNNEVVRFVQEKQQKAIKYPLPSLILKHAQKLLSQYIDGKNAIINENTRADRALPGVL